jgi:hypothetical protein
MKGGLATGENTLTINKSKLFAFDHIGSLVFFADVLGEPRRWPGSSIPPPSRYKPGALVSTRLSFHHSCGRLRRHGLRMKNPFTGTSPASLFIKRCIL